ncbi:MAG TPA: sigma-70 family RNA polymerase sigma factor [Asanoa sp.]|nr:sigma-70 family RNA polymerase sigma factor [Asanoa sp.]
MTRLTRREEQALVIATEAGDRDACRRLVDAFLPSIAAVARHFPTGAGVSRQELLQEGVAGLLLAARRYDAALETPFWAYASFWVRKAMQELVAELVRPVALSDRAVRGLAALKAARNEHVRDHRAEPTTPELVDATGYSREQVETLQAAERPSRSLDDPLHVDGSDTVVDPLAEDAYDQVLRTMEINEVRGLADQLSDREREVIRAHYGLGGPARTLSQIGGELGLTAERARQIEVAALRKLRDGLA